jgi:hypothetical protein
MIDRRRFLATATLAALLPAAARATSPAPVTVWRDPGCGCCLAWVDRLTRDLGRPVSVIEVKDMAAIKQARGVPADLRSCHTALIDGWVLEGHVPPADILRLIRSGDRAIRGLAVPGMPMGSPGMDIGHTHREAYSVIAFGPDGARATYARHG